MKISATIITLNEAKNLPRCLQSLQGVADEVIVVDSGSRDSTLEIARASGALVVTQPWLGYVGQKNFAISQATHDWILSVDADEELSEELRHSLRSLKHQIDHPSGYVISRIVEYQGKKIYYGDWFPDRLVRLFQKSKSQFEGGDVHERLKIEGTTKRLNGFLWHYTYENPEDRQRRLYSYATLWLKSAIRKNKKVHFCSPWIHAGWRFLRGYFLKQGFRNGALGLEIAWGNATEVYWKYQLLYQTRSANSR